MTDTAMAMVLIAGTTLAVSLLQSLFGGSWKLSTRLTSFEATLTAVQADIRKLGDVLEKLADLRGDIRLLDQRVTTAERDVQDLRHGHGFVTQRSDGGVNGEWP